MSPGLYKAFCLLVIVITTMLNFSNMDSRASSSRSWSSGSGGGSSGWGSGGGGHK